MSMHLLSRSADSRPAPRCAVAIGVRPPRCARIACLLLFVLLLGPMTGAVFAASDDLPLDTGRVGWTRVEFGAQKFFLQAGTVMRVLPAAEGDTVLRTPEQGEPIQADSTIRLAIDSTGLGIESNAVLSIDACTGRALQYEVLDRGRRLRERIYRYTDRGAFHWTRRPADGEEDADPASWSVLDAGMRDYPPQALGAAIIDPIGLVYIIAASALEQPGDRLDIVIYSRRQATRLAIVAEAFVAAVEAVDGQRAVLDVFAGSPPGEALRLSLTPQPLSGSEDPEFEFLGLNRDIRIWLDPVSRAPLRIAGKAKIVGELSLVLTAADFSAATSVVGPIDCLE